ncbi:MAG: ExbD/TolR family protein [bacterium]
MNFLNNNQEAAKPEVNIVSLIDVVLLMLIFFMITTSFVAQPGLKINLPVAKTGPVSTPDKIILTITENEQFYVDNKRVKLPELEKIFIEKAKENPKNTMVVKADEMVRHGTVVKVMDLAKTAGLNNLAIATKPENNRGIKKSRRRK